MREFHDILSELDSYPSGDSAAWIRRYDPLVDEIVRHRDVVDPEISVVVVAWNAAEFLVGCLEHLRDQVGLRDGALEILLVDNGGNTSIRAALVDLVDVEVRMRGNAHLCRARNLGVALARGQIINFIDDDGLVERDYMRNALRYFEDPDVVAIRSRIVAKNHPLFTTLATHYSRGIETVDDCLVTEGSSFLRREPYIEVGGFGEDMSGHEGIDLTYRLLHAAKGARGVYAPDVVMHHDYIDTWQKFWKKNWRYAGVNERTQARSPELSSFMDEYFARSFPKAALNPRERVAQEALKAARTLMRLGSAAQGRLRGKS